MGTIGLRQQILMAGSVAQVEALMLEGKTYEAASLKTKRSWKAAAERRIAQLKSNQ